MQSHNRNLLTPHCMRKVATTSLQERAQGGRLRLHIQEGILGALSGRWLELEGHMPVAIHLRHGRIHNTTGPLVEPFGDYMESGARGSPKQRRALV